MAQFMLLLYDEPAEERKQKWFCMRCGQLVQTCCD